MSFARILVLSALLASNAVAADYAERSLQSTPPLVRPPLDQVVPLAPPPLRDDGNVRPLIELEAFWIRVRECQTAAEVAVQLDARYRGLPLTFQGIDTRTGVFRRVTVLRAYRRFEDEGIDLPAVTFDIVSDGAPRAVTVPLWSGVRVIP